MKRKIEYFYSRKDLIKLVRKDLGIDVNDNDSKLSSIGLKVYE